MASRVDLQRELEEKLGSSNVYFQPPASKKLSYPAIVYSLNDIENKFADDSVYNQIRSYQVTIIDKNPDSVIVDKISRMKYCNFSRHYVSDNLNHDVFIIFY